MHEIQRLKLLEAELATLALDLETRLEELSSRPRLFLVKSEEALQLTERDRPPLLGEPTKDIE